MMERVLRAILAVTLLGVLLTPTTTLADVNDFVIDHFSGQYHLYNDEHGGRMTVHESIDLTFNGNNHGILRAIPEKYRGKSIKLKILSVLRDGQPEPYEAYGQNDNRVLKIGNAGKTITGKHRYEIRYEAQNIINFYPTHDEWYWDINGDEWLQPFTKVSGAVIFPDGWEERAEYKAQCFSGSYGSSAQNCSVTEIGNGYSFETTQGLSAYQTLTIVAASQKGIFTPRNFRDDLKDYLPLILGTLLPPLFIAPWAYRYWRLRGKDLKGRTTVIAEYEPPKSLSVAEAATIEYYKLSPKAVSATIIDLAIRKYLRIHQAGKKYSFELVNNDWLRLKQHEQQVLAGIFGTTPVTSQTVELSSLKNSYYKTISKLQNSLPSDLTKSGYFVSNPRLSGAPLLILAAALGIIGFIFFTVSPGFMLCAIILAIFSIYMPKRTERGVEVKDILEGLKLYMNTAEKDRIAMLQSPDAPYAGAGKSEPRRTIELFEKLLPYAMILNIEEKWAKQFEDIYNQPPEWYNGSWQHFNAGMLASNIASASSAMASSFSAPSSSSSSGFSGGGGSSGGGGGGGGGGGW